MIRFGRKNNQSEMTVDMLKERIAQHQTQLILDVRNADEYAASHIAGSKLIPLDQLATRLNDLPRDRPIIAMCRSGNRSHVATGMLQRAGFDVVNLKGGILQWEKQGLPVERGQ